MKKGLKRREDLSGKRIRAPEPPVIDYDAQKPVFSLEYMVEHSFKCCDKGEKADLAEALYKRSQLTWNDLRRTNKDGLGYESIPRTEIKAAIPGGVPEDVNAFISFRCSAKKPMIGFRVQRIFFIVWIDRNFSVYNHG